MEYELNNDMYVSPSVDQIDVQIRSRWFSVNVIGTLFGRSLFTMTEPFYVLSLLHQIKNYNYNNITKLKTSTSTTITLFKYRDGL